MSNLRNTGNFVAALLIGAAIASQAAEKDKNDGWAPLFDGKTFDAFNPESTSPPEEWTIEDGLLSTKPTGGGWLRSKKEYSDFEIRLEFRLSKRANSGLFLRADDGFTPHVDGLEVQLIDNDAFPDNPRSKACGALMLESGPTKSAAKKAGEWQTLHVGCEGPKVTVTLNGTVVVEEDLSRNAGREEDHPGRTRRKGFLGLQNRGELVDFRKIEIRELK